MEWWEEEKMTMPPEFIGCYKICSSCKYVQWNSPEKRMRSEVVGCSNKKGLGTCKSHILKVILLHSHILCEKCTLIVETGTEVHCLCNVHRIKKKILEEKDGKG